MHEESSITIRVRQYVLSVQMCGSATELGRDTIFLLLILLPFIESYQIRLKKMNPFS